MYLADLEIGKIMFQYKTGLLPNVFNNSFLQRNQVHGYDTRNASSFHIPKCRTNIRRFSFQYQGPLFFNSLSPDVVSSVSVSTFKKNLKKLLLTLLVPFSPPPTSSSFSLSALSFFFSFYIPFSFVYCYSAFAVQLS